MAGVTREQEQSVREFVKRTGGGCIDTRESTEDRIRRLDAEVADGLRRLRLMRDEAALEKKKGRVR